MSSVFDDSNLSAIIDPQERLQHLILYSNAVEVDIHIPPARYYRSGLEMVRMANVYYKEGSLENAYVLYLKFMTLFLEKIRKHPDFNQVPVNAKAINQAKLREVLPKAEKLKAQLLHQYQEEYNRYIADLKSTQKAKHPKKDFYNKPKSNTLSTPGGSSLSDNFISVEPPPNIGNINYPDPNIPSEPPLKSEESYVPPDPIRVPVTPLVDRSVKPPGSNIYSTYEKAGLRTVIVPSKVMSQFEKISQRNTINNIETCGVLAGKLAQDELTITHMILPKQQGTSDTCNTTNEEEIFDFQDQHHLITIGWIHTHPTQTAFLSSVDLHTHCPYQLLMPEAIAIVCAPRYKETGFFVLTPDYGLQYIANCRKAGFHPHPTQPPLFMIADHIKIQEHANLEVLDLRT